MASNFEVKKKKLTNFKVIERQDKNNRTYFIIFDNNEQTNNAYFCWSDTLQAKWYELTNKAHEWDEIVIEYREKEQGNQVVGISVKSQQQIF